MSKKSLDRLGIASGSIYPEFAQQVADNIGVELIEVDHTRFANSEQYVRFEESVRRKDLFVMQAHAAVPGRSVDDAIAEQRQLISAARLASAKRITAVFPYMAYSRQDRKTKSGEPITASDTVRDFIRSGARRLLTAELHSGQIQGFSKRPFDHLTALPTIRGWLKETWLAEYGYEDVVLVSPDGGHATVVAKTAERLGIGFAIIDKRRNPKTRKAEAYSVIGNVVGKHCMFLDDMIDGAGSLRTGSERVMDDGAASVSAVATHGILSPDSVENIAASPMYMVGVTNSLPQAANLAAIPKLQEIDIVPLFSAAIPRIHRNQSLSELFDGEHLS